MNKTSLAADSQANETILLLGNYRPTLTLARVFSKQGYRVISGLEGYDGGAEYCRFVDAIWDHPDIEKDPNGFKQALKSFVAANDVAIIFPVSEEFVRFFSDSPNLIEGGPPVALVQPELVQRCQDKVYMMNLAHDHGVPTAAFAIARNLDKLSRRAEELGFPIVIRPEDSTKKLNGKKALFVSSKRDLMDQFGVWPAEQTGLILQKQFSGDRHTLYFAAENGKLFRYADAGILKTNSLDGSGFAVEGITVVPAADLQMYTRKLVKVLNYTGIGCAQFLVDQETRKVSFLEINPRIAGSHAVPEWVGLGLSKILVDIAQNKKLDTTYIEGRPGVRYVWTFGDLEAVKSAWSSRQIGNMQALKRGALAVYAGLRADIHMTFSWSDPKPGLMALTKLIPDWNKMLKRVRKNGLGAVRTGPQNPAN